MKITCTSCQSHLQLDDSKVPTGSFKVKCSRCGSLVAVSRTPSASQSPAETTSLRAEPPSSPPKVETSRGSESQPTEADTSEVPGSFPGGSEISDYPPSLKSDSIPSEHDAFGDSIGKSALICESDGGLSGMLAKVARELGYRVDTASNIPEAIRRLDGSVYHLVITGTSFPDDRNGGALILGKINSQKPDIRRGVFAVLVGADVKTTDASRAFFSGANILVNHSDVSVIGTLIQTGQRYFHKIYHLYYDIASKTGDHL